MYEYFRSFASAREKRGGKGEEENTIEKGIGLVSSSIGIADQSHQQGVHDRAACTRRPMTQGGRKVLCNGLCSALTGVLVSPSFRRPPFHRVKM